MIQYTPLDSGVKWERNLAELRTFNWISQTAEWDFPDGERTLKVQFRGDIIVRILDEFPLSTEANHEQWQGLLPHHFA